MSEETGKDFEKLLSDPFESADVEWRVQASGMRSNNTAWVRVIPYITSRAVQQRLDDVFGIWGWENAFKEARQSTVIVTEWVNNKPVKKEKLINNWLCGITIIDGDKRVTKWDGAAETSIEPFKGGLSGSEKRAAVQMGIGRYLYHFEAQYVDCEVLQSRFNVPDGGNHIDIKLDKKDNKSAKIPYVWFPPEMPDWALPSVEIESLIGEIETASDVITLRSAFSRAYKYANSFNRGSLVQLIVEAKDKRKSKLTDDSDSEDKADLMKVLVWLERAVTDEILSADNESVLKLAKKRLAKGINDRCMEKGLDVVELLQVLEKHYTTQLLKLTGDRP